MVIKKFGESEHLISMPRNRKNKYNAKYFKYKYTQHDLILLKNTECNVANKFGIMIFLEK